jgi:tRNA (guanine-N7-)-methyltransferase
MSRRVMAAPKPSAEPHVTAPPIRYGDFAPAAPDGDIDLQALLPGDGEIEIEIGFGRGMFLIERAEVAKSSRLLGIEVKRKWAYLVSERLKKLGHTHARVFGGDAREILPRLGPPGSVARVFMHFPDPWWKKRHAKRRLNDAETFDPLARLLCSGGEMYIQADVEERAETFVEALRSHEAFDLPETPYLVDNPYGARSNREKRAIEDGLPIFRILATRR